MLARLGWRVSSQGSDSSNKLQKVHSTESVHTAKKCVHKCAHCDHFEQMCAIDDQLANLLDLTLATSLPA